MAVVTGIYMFSFAFDLGERLPAGGLPFPEHPRIEFAWGAVAPPWV